MKRDISLIHFGKGEFFPLNLLYLIPHLKRENISISVTDHYNTDFFKKREFSAEGLFSFLCTIKEEIIAISCMQDILPKLILALIEFKTKFPHKKIILGGSAPTNSRKSIIEKFGHVIDFIVIGIGDFVLPKLVRKLLNNEKNFEDLAGICFKKNGKVIFSTPEFLPNYFEIKDKIPIDEMGFEYFDIKKYNSFPIVTSKGCPYRCSFCSLNHHFNFGKKLIYGDIKKTVELISYLNSNAPKLGYSVVDEAFVLNKKRVINFCNELKKNKKNIMLGVYGRVNLMDEELMKKLSSSGFDIIHYGIESGSNKVLKKINKGFTIEQAVDVLLKSKKYFNRVVTTTIWGFPFESMNDFIDTILINFYFKSYSIKSQLHFLIPLRDSMIFDKYFDTLKFNDIVFSDITSGIGWGNINDESFKKTIDFIKKNKEIFPYYFYYDSPLIQKKKELLEKIIKKYKNFKPLNK